MLHKRIRYQISLQGVVQGIGLRPKLYQLANQFALTGYCQNTEKDVVLHWQGNPLILDNAVEQLQHFLSLFGSPAIALKRIQSIESEVGFDIKKSSGSSKLVGIIAPDIATCSDCLKELHNTNDHRYHYPFINCAQCGPRFTISKTQPYDRVHTSMTCFTMCHHCQSEYDDPSNRRFHAQTITCQDCGPSLWLANTHKNTVSKNARAIEQAIDYLKQGKIIAIKGVGGFHLAALSTLDEPLKRLRKIKHRPDKPFALMVKNIDTANHFCVLSANERAALNSAQAPIVICKKRSFASISKLVAPKLDTLGIMLPYSALHHLILSELNDPLVLTSANLHAEPIIYQNSVMLKQLNSLADYCLLHNRDIVTPLEDSIVIEIAKQIRTIRLARGLIPFTHPAPQPPQPFISLGGHLKNHIGLWHANKITLSHYFGDLSSLESMHRFNQHFQTLLKRYPKAHLIRDYHPDYACNLEGRFTQNKQISVFHHIAHIFAVIEEHKIKQSALGFAWDGFGLGQNNTLCGCEIYHIDKEQVQQIACLAPIKMLGNEQAFKEPRRVALSLCESLLHNGLLSDIPPFVISQFTESEICLFKQMFQKNINTSVCASMGRLFDGVSALLGGPAVMSYEGQAALMLEHLASKASVHCRIDSSYPVHYIKDNQMNLIDWQSMVKQLLTDLSNGFSRSHCAYRFHLWCMNIINSLAISQDIKNIILSGGVFQNKLLAELCFNKLTSKGYLVYLPQKVPTNDAGLAFGQIARIKYMTTSKNEVTSCV